MTTAAMKRKQEARLLISDQLPISDLQTIHLCEHSRLRQSSHCLSTSPQSFVHMLYSFRFFVLLLAALPKLQTASSRLPRTHRFEVFIGQNGFDREICKVSVLSHILFVPLSGAAGEQLLTDVCGQQQKPLWC